jgi:GntR family transcriptional regulator, transcriptional repressor for pyruvate dehydrogenase complex
MVQQKLNRLTLAEQVAQLLVERIEQEKLHPGDSFPSIAKLAEEYNVSKPIIREALKTLEGRGIVEVSNGRTPTVKPLTSQNLRTFFEHAVAFNPRSLIELLEIRRGLEIQSALLAARNRNAEEMAEILALVAQMRDNVYNPVLYTELDLRLHLMIALASRNTLMVYMIESIRNILRDTIKEGLRSRFTDEQIQYVQYLHERIVDAIHHQDTERVQQAMAEHFDDAINAIYMSMLQTTSNQ